MFSIYGPVELYRREVYIYKSVKNTKRKIKGLSMSSACKWCGGVIIPEDCEIVGCDCADFVCEDCGEAVSNV
jgi:hypothetical protein